MPTEEPFTAPPAHARRMMGICAAVAVVAWMLLVARDQYGVKSLESHDIALDVLFVGAVVAGLAARGAAVYGSRYVVLRLAVVSTATAVALGAAEGAARLVFRNVHSSGNAGDYIARRGGGSTPRLNSLGFRDREVPPKSPDLYRIVVVGDSFTWGAGIEPEERFSDLLRHFLGSTYEVVNFGRPAQDMAGHLDGLEDALEIMPDFVLLQLYINDFETAQMERPRVYPLLPFSLHRTLEGASLFYLLLNAEWAHLQGFIGDRYTYPAYMARYLLDPEAPNARRTSDELRAFFARALDARVGVGAVLFPAANQMGHTGAYPFGFLHDRVRNICAEEQVPCLDLLPAFSKIRDPRTMFVNRFDAHPNAMANRRAAYEIMARFGSIWLARNYNKDRRSVAAR